MLPQSIRASRPLLARLARQQYAAPIRRTLMAPTAVRSADLVQDMYLKELKTYKPAPVKPSDAEGHVQKFAVPKSPPSPEEGDLANDLQAYETQAVEVEGQASGLEPGKAVPEEDWFEEEEDSEKEAAAAH